MHNAAPKTLTEYVDSKSWRVIAGAVGDSVRIPALLISTSTCPNSWAMVLAAVAMEVSSATLTV